MTYKTILLDVDGTLLDFTVSASIALRILFERRGWHYDESVFETYEEINNALWEKYERGEMPREEVLTTRFRQLFDALGVDDDEFAFEPAFRTELENNPAWIDGAVELLDYLAAKYELDVVTNGVAKTQHKRMKLTGLDRWITKTFISEEVGAPKPQKEFFDAALKGVDRASVILIGDSLTADIRGANDAGIKSIWYDPAGKGAGTVASPDYIVNRLEEIKKIL